MIQSVNSNTSLTLDKPFAENTATNSNYRILLNTAAHFPSDTAAKVERALEQLSDINEAAINNDRTVTAATKVNGKGIASITGDLNVYPASVNTNDGGRLKFHYNQSSSATSSIYEEASGRLRFNGDMNISGRFISQIIRKLDIARGSNFTGGDYGMIYNQDNNNANVARIINNVSYPSASSYTNSLGMYVYNPTNTASGTVARIAVGYNQDGAFTLCPTPPVNSNDDSIATTAWVNNFITRGWTILNFDSVEIPNNTVTNLYTYNCTLRGLYIFQYVAYFTTGNSFDNGYRAMYVNYSSEAGLQSDRFGAAYNNSVAGQNTYLMNTRIERLTMDNTIYINVRQNSGSTLACSGGIRIARIGETS